jgi:ADP-ribose pyrophosphatase YjhB (NUDIX family)
VADVTDPNHPDRHAYLAHGNATQARKRVAANAVIRDTQGRVLLVDPTYKEHWDIPGGMAEANEPPTMAVARELREELSLDVTVGRLLLVDWVGPQGPWDDQLVFVFDGGTLDDDRATTLTITDSEIAAYRFATVIEAAELLRPDVHRRLEHAHHALANGPIVYGECERDW